MDDQLSQLHERDQISRPSKKRKLEEISDDLTHYFTRLGDTEEQPLLQEQVRALKTAHRKEEQAQVKMQHNTDPASLMESNQRMKLTIDALSNLVMSMARKVSQPTAPLATELRQ